MKLIPIILIFTFFISISSCNRDKPLKIYSQIDYYKNKDTNIIIIDTFCINQKKKALNDIKKGKLTYFLMQPPYLFFGSNKEMEGLLAKYDIGIDSTLTTCLRPPKGFSFYCYENIMEKEIKKRYGENFIDSLRNIAEINYIHKHPNKIYNFEDCDTISRYPFTKSYADFFNAYQRDFFNEFRYPKKYYYRKDNQDYSYTSAYFIIHKDSTLSQLKIETEFQNKLNEKYKTYFENSVRKFVLKTHWIPARKKGIVVNSNIELTFFNN